MCQQVSRGLGGFVSYLPAAVHGSTSVGGGERSGLARVLGMSLDEQAHRLLRDRDLSDEIICFRSGDQFVLSIE